jgi:hypothetical protein
MKSLEKQNWKILLMAFLVMTMLSHVIVSVNAIRPVGTHPGHAYFEQPCCGRSHLRHHKGQISLFF